MDLDQLPVPKPAIVFSKVAVNLTITVPVTAVSWGLLVYTLRVGLTESILMLAVPVIYACYSALLGVMVNLKLPKLDWTSEVAAIKQSASVLVTMVIGVLTLAVPAVLFMLLPGGRKSHPAGILHSNGSGLRRHVQIYPDKRGAVICEAVAAEETTLGAGRDLTCSKSGFFVYSKTNK